MGFLHVSPLDGQAASKVLGTFVSSPGVSAAGVIRCSCMGVSRQHSILSIEKSQVMRHLYNSAPARNEGWGVCCRGGLIVYRTSIPAAEITSNALLDVAHPVHDAATVCTSQSMSNSIPVFLCPLHTAVTGHCGGSFRVCRWSLVGGCLIRIWRCHVQTMDVVTCRYCTMAATPIHIWPDLRNLAESLVLGVALNP